jgi:KDO2-lipid IV(A) lauroyltransferase
MSQAVGWLIGYGHFLTRSKPCRVTQANIGLCFDHLSAVEQKKLVLDSLISTGKTLMETPAAWLGDSKYLLKWISKIEGEELLLAAQADSQGILLLLPHLGNWELLNVYLSQRGGTTALYKPPKLTSLGDAIVALRSQYGNEMVATDKRGLSRLFRALAEGRVVTVLPDQIPESGLFADFFGSQAFTDRLGYRLSQRGNVTVLAVAVYRLPSGLFKICFSKPHPDFASADEQTAVQGINKTVEACVRVCPEQYQWEYKRFKLRPEGEKKLYSFEKEEFH